MKILKSLMFIVAIAAIAGGATYAAYHKDGSVLGSTFSNTDSMALMIDQNASPTGYDWVNTINLAETNGFGNPFGGNLNARPGSFGEQVLDIKNVGNVAANATIKFHVREDTPLYHNMNLTVSFDSNHDGTFNTAIASGPLTAWNNSTHDLGQLSGDTENSSAPGKLASVKIEWSVPTEAGNDIMGSNVVVDTIFGLDQI